MRKWEDEALIALAVVVLLALLYRVYIAVW